MNIQNDYKKNNNLGSVISLSENGDFGFINLESEKTIFFHKKSVLGKVSLHDKVVFSIFESKNKNHLFEARYVRRVYHMSSDSTLVLSSNIAMNADVQEVLLDLLPTINIKDFDNQDEIILESEVPGQGGLSYACSTTVADDVFYAKRFNKKGFSRFVRERKPEISRNFIVIIKRKAEHFEVVAAYFGPRSHPEPWDRIATPQSVEFWKTHALIPDPIFKIDYSSVKNFDPNFFKSFEEIQAGEESPNE